MMPTGSSYNQQVPNPNQQPGRQWVPPQGGGPVQGGAIGQGQVPTWGQPRGGTYRPPTVGQGQVQQPPQFPPGFLRLIQQMLMQQGPNFGGPMPPWGPQPAQNPMDPGRWGVMQQGMPQGQPQNSSALRIGQQLSGWR